MKERKRLRPLFFALKIDLHTALDQLSTEKTHATVAQREADVVPVGE